jgi:hypothetical protein
MHSVVSPVVSVHQRSDWRAMVASFLLLAAGSCSRPPADGVIRVLDKPWADATPSARTVVVRSPHPSFVPRSGEYVLLGKEAIPLLDRGPARVIKADWAECDLRAAAIDQRGTLGAVILSSQPMELDVRVYALETGFELRKLAPPKLPPAVRTVQFLGFEGPERLLAILVEPGRVSAIQWSMADGEVAALRSIATDVPEAALREDGSQLATVEKSGVVLRDMETGEKAQELTLPEAVSRRCAGLAFSPDDKELAGYFPSDADDSRLIAWDEEGEVVADVAFPPLLPRHAMAGNCLLWLPEGTGWLVDSRLLVDRASGKPLWLIGERSHGSGSRYFASPDQLYVALFHNASSGTGAGSLEAVRIPREKLRVGLAAMQGKDTAVVYPGESVSLAVQLHGVEESRQSQVETRLKTTASTVLRRGGHPVADGRSLVLDLNYSEQTAGTQRLSDSSGNAVYVTNVRGRLDAELMLEGYPKPLWSVRLERLTQPDGRALPSNEELRQAMFYRVLRALLQTAVPLSIPRDPEAPAMPLLSVIGGSQPAQPLPEDEGEEAIP